MTEIKVRQMGWINVIGLFTLMRKEVGRFIAVYTQTIVAPVITTLLFYAVFSLAFGGLRPDVKGIPYMEFLAPGLIIMTMVQNAFANTSSSIVIAKVQGNIVDVLMPPLSPMEMMIGYATGGILRGFLVGLVCAITMAVFTYLPIQNVIQILVFGILGSMMLALLGIVGGLWADKFDHIAAVTNFIVMPLTFLSGTFYSIDRLPEIWQVVAHYNPFFYMIDGFRGGFIGMSDASTVNGLIILIGCNALLFSAGYRMLKTGYKIKQ